MGADGRNSTVAKRTGATEYHAVDTERGGYWAYFQTTPEYDALPFPTHIEIQGESANFAFRTNREEIS